MRYFLFMIHAWKYVSETPLQCIERLRSSYASCATAKLSYAGRLDPMAHGILPLLNGDKENKSYKNYLTAEKTYRATFLIGVATDTQDILGRHMGSQSEIIILESDCEKIAIATQKITKQTYPWFSAKTVKGKKLFDYYRSGENTIKRPERSVAISHAVFERSEILSTEAIFKIIHKKVTAVSGDFRQEAILEDWNNWLESHRHQTWQVVTYSFTVSAGTYIRALTDSFPAPTLLFSLERTAIHFTS